MGLLGRAARAAAAALLAPGLVLGAAGVAVAGARPGKPAPPLELPDLGGRPVALEELRGRVVWVEFWATWCPPCRKALPAIEDTARRLGPRGLVVLAVSIDRDPERAREFAREHLPSSPLRILLDPSGAVHARYGGAGMPSVFLIDREGTLRLSRAGYSVEKLAEIEREVEVLLGAGGAGRAPEGRELGESGGSGGPSAGERAGGAGGADGTGRPSEPQPGR